MALEEGNSNTNNEAKVDKEITTKPSFKELMGERKTVSRWFVMTVFLVGIFCGTSLGVVFMWLAFVS